MQYLLDTCVISDFVKGEPNTRKQLLSHSPATVAYSSITQMEVAYGLALKPAKAKLLQPMLQQLFDSMVAMPFGAAEAAASADLRAHLKSIGQPIGAYDVLIAGTALANELIMVTANVKDFARVPGLVVENWRES